MNVNIKLDEGRHNDLKFIQDYYSDRTGMKFSQAQTLRRLLYETANIIRNTGETYPNRDWKLENQEAEMHREYAKILKKGKSNESE